MATVNDHEELIALRVIVSAQHARNVQLEKELAETKAKKEQLEAKADKAMANLNKAVSMNNAQRIQRENDHIERVQLEKELAEAAAEREKVLAKARAEYEKELAASAAEHENALAKAKAMLEKEQAKAKKLKNTLYLSEAQHSAETEQLRTRIDSLDCALRIKAKELNQYMWEYVAQSEDHIVDVEWIPATGTSEGYFKATNLTTGGYLVTAKDLDELTRISKSNVPLKVGRNFSPTVSPVQVNIRE